MQKQSSLKIPVGVKSLAKMMVMEEVEVRFFPKLEELRVILKDYNFKTLSKKALMDKLQVLKAKCLEENLDAYAEGVGELMTAIRYKY